MSEGGRESGRERERERERGGAAEERREVNIEILSGRKNRGIVRESFRLGEEWV